MAWTAQDTTNHQDHVIAHVIGSSMLGYFVHDESIYLLLDIGFIWQIYLDGEMGLLPSPVVIRELDADENFKQVLLAESDILLGQQSPAAVNQITPAPVECLIQEVTLFIDSEKRLIMLRGANDLAVETSLLTREIRLYQSTD